MLAKKQLANDDGEIDSAIPMPFLVERKVCTGIPLCESCRDYLSL